jgi:hypothetical protein
MHTQAQKIATQRFPNSIQQSIMLSTALLLFCLFIIIMPLSPVVATLCLSEPINTTIYTAGQRAQISWVDDGHDLKLAMIGPLKIDLFTNFNVGYHHG